MIFDHMWNKYSLCHVRLSFHLYQIFTLSPETLSEILPWSNSSLCQNSTTCWTHLASFVLWLLRIVYGSVYGDGQGCVLVILALAKGCNVGYWKRDEWCQAPACWSEFLAPAMSFWWGSLRERARSGGPAHGLAHHIETTGTATTSIALGVLPILIAARLNSTSMVELGIIRPSSSNLRYNL